MCSSSMHLMLVASHRGSDPQLVRGGSLGSSKDLGSDPAVTPLVLLACSDVSIHRALLFLLSTPCLVLELSLSMVPLHVTLCLFKKGEESQVVSGSIVCAANSPSYSPTL